MRRGTEARPNPKGHAAAIEARPTLCTGVGGHAATSAEATSAGSRLAAAAASPKGSFSRETAKSTKTPKTEGRKGSRAGQTALAPEEAKGRP